MKKLWNKLFKKTKPLIIEEIDWESENVSQFGNDYNEPTWFDMYQDQRKKYKALVKWAEKNNKQLFLNGAFGYGYRLEIKDKINEITESK
jgi:hypothetical protein